MGVSLAASRKRDVRAGHSARSASLHQYLHRATGQAMRLCGRRYSTLTTAPALWRSRNQNNTRTRTSGMVPLYAARVQDLGPDDWPSSNAECADTRRKSRRAGCYAGLG